MQTQVEATGARALVIQGDVASRDDLEGTLELEERMVEVHPEVSFAALAGQPLRYSNRTWNGQMERRRLLASAGIELPDELTAGQAAADDVLDAAIAAWSAARKERGEAATLPADPPPCGMGDGSRSGTSRPGLLQRRLSP